VSEQMFAGDGVTCYACDKEIPEGYPALIHWDKDGVPIVVC
jgi:hypothetical protein